MGWLGDKAKDSAKSGVKTVGKGAVTKVRKASKHYCPGSSNNRHHFISHKHNDPGHHAHGEHLAFYCGNEGCGLVKTW